jgi:hypothetical protein
MQRVGSLVVARAMSVYGIVRSRPCSAGCAGYLQEIGVMNRSYCLHSQFQVLVTPASSEVVGVQSQHSLIACVSSTID